MQLAARLPLLWLSLAFLGGIWLASWISLPAWAWLILAAAALLLTFPLRRALTNLPTFNLQPPGQSLEVKPSTILLLNLSLITLLLGSARYQASLPEITVAHIAWYNDREYDLLVTGWLSEPPDYRDTYTNLRLRVEAVDTGDGDLPAGGLLLARLPPNTTYHYGERIRLRGRLETPPEDEGFSYRDYLARQGIHAYMSWAEATRLPGPSTRLGAGSGGNRLLAAVYALKERALTNVYRLFPDPEASLLAGILLGVESGLPRDLQQAFKDTGTAHIIAISGFNIAIIAGLFVTLFSRLLGPRRGALAAVIGIALYTLLVGAEASVVRAAIMGTLSLLARQVGRRQEGLNTLAFTAALMALFNPLILWDAGFQLSFFATLGLVLYAAPFQQWAAARLARSPRLARPLSEYVLFTLAAQLTTLPIMAYHFKRLSLVSLLANPFILPAQPAVMILGGLAVLLSLLYLPLGQLAAWAAWPFIVYTIRVVELFAALPKGVIILGDFSPWFAVLFYAALLSVTFAGSRLRTLFSALRQRVPALPVGSLLAALLLAVLLTWRAAFAAPDGLLHLTFLDVGSGDAVLIQTPSGRNLLINGGPSASRLSAGLGRRLPPFQRRLDWLVIASTQENQVAALPRVAERYRPDDVLWSGNVEASFSARELDAWLSEEGIPIVRAAAGQSLDLGNGASLRVQAVGARGATLLIAWRDFRALLPLGLDFEALDQLEHGALVGPVNVLLLAESGYAPINPPEWIANLNPQVVILSVAPGDKDGLPSPETLEALEQYSLLRSDAHGWIRVSTDGEQMWAQTEKGNSEYNAPE